MAETAAMNETETETDGNISNSENAADSNGARGARGASGEQSHAANDAHARVEEGASNVEIVTSSGPQPAGHVADTVGRNVELNNPGDESTHGRSAADGREDETEVESEWEYEYDENETQDFYFSINFVPRLKKSTRTSAAQKAKEQVQQVSNDATPQAETVPNDGRDAETVQNLTSTREKASEQPPSQEIQILGLHTSNPLLLYDGTHYSASWTSPLGTNLFFDQNDLKSRPQQPIEKRWPENGSSSLIAKTSAMLLARPIIVKPKPAAAFPNGRPGPSNAAASAEPKPRRKQGRPPQAVPTVENPAVAAQLRFLESLRAAKAARGEHDEVPATGYRGMKRELTYMEPDESKRFKVDRPPAPERPSRQRGSGKKRSGWHKERGQIRSGTLSSRALRSALGMRDGEPSPSELRQSREQRGGEQNDEQLMAAGEERGLQKAQTEPSGEPRPSDGEQGDLVMSGALPP